MMAKLTGMYEDQPLQKRQLPLEIDETLTMIMEMEKVVPTGKWVAKSKELERFAGKFSMLSTEDIEKALIVSAKDLFESLTNRMPCVGCRRSVERLFNQLTETGNTALDPLVITEDALLTVDKESASDVNKLYELFYIHGNHLNRIIEAIPKNKKNRRCPMHSLESQRTKPFGICSSWLSIWNVMAKKCQEEVVLFDADTLLDTLETYLRKHKFCGECKVKVIRAYDLLVGNLDTSKEKGYVEHLYKGIRCCPSEQHIHINNNADYIARLIARAEPEFRGKFVLRERHAKTIENAQEEVLTCLGICLYERLYRISQRLNEEHQIWQMLYCLGVHEMRKNFELAVEEKQGFSQLERVCEEFTKEEEEKELRLLHKRMKRRKKRGRPCHDSGEDTKENESEDYKCDIEPEVDLVLCDNYKEEPVLCNCHESCSRRHSADNTSSESCTCCCKCPWNTGKANNFFNDSGYCSVNSNDSSSSCENSEIACSDTCCNHESESFQLPSSCEKTNASESTDPVIDKPQSEYQWNCCNRNRCGLLEYGSGTSLQCMLEQWCPSEDEQIPPEEVKELKAKLCQLKQQRQELRRTLLQRFTLLRHEARFRCQPLIPVVNRNVNR